MTVNRSKTVSRSSKWEVNSDVKRKRITLIGPVYPYKGGISHYTSLLCRALQKKYDVQLLSFSLQYPKVLYHHEQKDYKDDSLRIEGALYAINTVNPFNWPGTARIIHDFHPDLVILEWWHPYFAPCYCGILDHLAKLYQRDSGNQGESKEPLYNKNFQKDKKYQYGKRYKKDEKYQKDCSRKEGHTDSGSDPGPYILRPQILFLCHNVLPHERFPMDKTLTERTLRKGTLYIVQSGRDAADLQAIIPQPRYCQTVHPTYDVFHFGNYTRQTARQALGIGEKQKVLLFFGFVREYKGLKYLLEAMPEIVTGLAGQLDAVKASGAADTAVTLLVAGDFSSEESRQRYLAQISQLGIQNYIQIHDGYIPDKEIEKYFLASDLVVCPYTDATQSGIVQIAYGFDLPVVATRVGGLPDVVEDGKTGYLVEKEDPHQLAEAILRYFREEMPSTQQTQESSILLPEMNALSGQHTGAALNAASGMSVASAQRIGAAARMSSNIRAQAWKFSWDHLVEEIDKLAGWG